VSSMPQLTSLNISYCEKVTDVGVRAVSSMPQLTSLDISYCEKVTAAGVQVLRTAAPNLHIDSEYE
jgi:hypothetical protein